MTEIIPAILARSAIELREKISSLPSGINLIHLDVLEEDVWVPQDIEFEAHLMVPNPEFIADRWIERGAKRIIVHSRTFFGHSGSKKSEVGLGIELHVPLEEVYDLIHQASFVQLMSIDEIGEQGHPFNPKVFDRIKEVKRKFPDIVISVDGGVNENNYQALIEAGVDRLIVGSAFNKLWSRTK